MQRASAVSEARASTSVRARWLNQCTRLANPLRSNRSNTMSDWSVMDREWLTVPPSLPYDNFVFPGYEPYLDEKVSLSRAHYSKPPPTVTAEMSRNPPTPPPMPASMLLPELQLFPDLHEMLPPQQMMPQQQIMPQELIPLQQQMMPQQLIPLQQQMMPHQLIPLQQQMSEQQQMMPQPHISLQQQMMPQQQMQPQQLLPPQQQMMLQQQMSPQEQMMAQQQMSPQEQMMAQQQNPPAPQQTMPRQPRKPPRHRTQSRQRPPPRQRMPGRQRMPSPQPIQPSLQMPGPHMMTEAELMPPPPVPRAPRQRQQQARQQRPSIQPLIGQSARELRNRAEKMRRDRMNESIKKLASIVPTVIASPRRVDKTGVLRLTANYLRSNEYVFGDSIYHTPQFSCGFTRALLNLLQGVIITVTHTGLIVSVSYNVKEFLGYTELELLGQNLKSIVHIDDHKILLDQLRPQTVRFGPYGLIVPPDGPGAAEKVAKLLASEKRSFTIRIKRQTRVRLEPDHYITCHVEGSLRKADRACREATRNIQMMRRTRARTENPCTSGNDAVFVGIVRPTSDTFCTEAAIEAYSMEYRTRHSIDGEIIQTEQRISLITGYMGNEVYGLNAMNFIHKDEVRWVIVALQEMFRLSLLYGESCYRLLTKTGKFIYLRTRGRLEIDSDSCAKTFVCTNTVVDEIEGREHVRIMKEKFEFAVRQNEIVNPLKKYDKENDNKDQIEHPKQLQKQILHLITNIPKLTPHKEQFAIIPPDRERTISVIQKIYKTKCVASMPTESGVVQQEITPPSPINTTESFPVTTTEAYPVTTTESCVFTNTEAYPVNTTEAYPFTNTEAYPVNTTEAYPFTNTESCLYTTTEAYPVTTSESCVYTNTGAYPISTTESYLFNTTDAYPFTTTEAYPVTTTESCLFNTTKAYPFTNNESCLFTTTEACPITTTESCPFTTRESYLFNTTKACPVTSTESSSVTPYNDVYSKNNISETEVSGTSGASYFEYLADIPSFDTPEEYFQNNIEYQGGYVSDLLLAGPSTSTTATKRSIIFEDEQKASSKKKVMEVLEEPTIDNATACAGSASLESQFDESYLNEQIEQSLNTTDEFLDLQFADLLTSKEIQDIIDENEKNQEDK